jgi:hypothetical protein
MNKQAEERSQLARREANDMFARDRVRQGEVVKEREKAFAAQSQKTARLRAARLAREADERAVLAAAEAAKPPAPTKKKRAKSAAAD